VSHAETLPPDWAEAIARAANPFDVAIGRYARAPVAFVREVLHCEPDPWQLEALRAISRGHTRIAIRSAHGCGKTALAAWLMVWFCNTRSPFKCVCTAPSAPQLYDSLWSETTKWFSSLPAGWRQLWDLQADHIRLKADAECFISARTSRRDQPEALQGVHSANVLLVCDEASGIEENVYEAASGSMSTPGAITVLIGNPTRATGYFWRVMTMERDRWHCMKVSGLDSPRVDPKFIEEIAERYGRDSNAFRIRCLGEWPTADDNTLIPADLIDSAMVRDVPIDMSASSIWGCDVARFGNDASTLVKRRGLVVEEMPRSWHQFDTMMLAGAIKAEWDAAGANKPALIVVDVIGIGAGVVDRLHEQSVPVLGLNVAEVPSTTGRYARLRDELWVRAREWLSGRNVRLPRHDRLREDLASPRYAFLSDGRLQVESKQLMRARGLPSTDFADALCLTFAEAGLGIASGMSSGLFDSRGMTMDLKGMEI
jgi:hypothetical protein